MGWSRLPGFTFLRLLLAAVIALVSNAPAAAAPLRSEISGSPAMLSTEFDGTAGSQLASLLRPDGTLDLSSGFQGSLDVRGWAFGLTPDGRPRFEPAGD